jgi:hypothetical protein
MQRRGSFWPAILCTRRWQSTAVQAYYAMRLLWPGSGSAQTTQ